ncbi:MAG: hypothetical protein V4689_14830 [Verrucomicrobiota bacterium]
MKRIYITLGFTLAGMLLGWCARDLARPQYPEYWNNLRLGMSTKQAHLVVPQLENWKEADQVTVDYGDRYWNLNVFYDAAGKITAINKRYVDRRFGPMNQTIVSPSP